MAPGRTRQHEAQEGASVANRSVNATSFGYGCPFCERSDRRLREVE